jgi:hypothetical protein
MRSDVIGLFLLSSTIGCCGSLHPFHSEAVLVDSPSLPGRWVPEPDSDNVLWTITRRGKGAFHIEVEMDGQETFYDARLVRIDGLLYLDFWLRQEEESSILMGETIPVHYFAQLEISGESLRVNSMIAPSELEPLLKKWGVSYFGRRTNPYRRIYITASTEQLQKLVEDHASELFGPTNTARRLK